MFKRLMTALGGGPKSTAGSTPATAGGAPWPPGSAANSIYRLLFCDDLAAFAPTGGATPTDWQAVLFAASPDPATVLALASDAGAESRVRGLACHWLRTNGHAPPPQEVLGVVFEVPLEGGLDVLAAYADGAVRYLNHTGRMTLIEPDSLADANDQAKTLIALAGPVVARIGPWDKPRRPPPPAPSIRVSFLVTDGLYFGEGPFEALAQDPVSGGVIQAGTTLLTMVVDRASERPG